MVTRTRKITTVAEESLDLEYCTLQEARDKLDALIAEYGPTAKINYYQLPYTEDSYLYVFKERFETDEEMSARIATEEQHEKVREERDRKEFERLQAKFNTKAE